MPFKLRFPRLSVKVRGILIVAIATLAGFAIGNLCITRPPRAGDLPKAIPDVFLLGERLPLDESSIKRALEQVRRQAARELRLQLPDNRVERLRPAELGAEIDKVRLTELVKGAQDGASYLRRYWASRGTPLGLTLPVPIVIDPERAMPRLLGLKEQVDRAPVDARLDLEQRRVTPEVVGRKLDLQATLSALEAALAAGKDEVLVVVREQQPRRRAAELADVKFDHVLGYFETHYSRLEKDRARTFNLRLAASKFDGYVLLPGETFDFNDVVGPRDEANGYKVAPVIASGEVVDGIGGGTCQVSGTLHGAAFFAGLEIVERYPHTRPSSYIKMGLDATVVYPNINFRLRNNLPFPVVLHEAVRDGIVRAEILGTEDGPTVTLIRRIDAAIPYEQVERPDGQLPEGTRILAQRGVAGFKLHRYRIIRRGSHATRERWDDVYPPTTQIIRMGAGPRTLETKIKDDPHPEYRADELLVTTLRKKKKSDVEKTFKETRQPGKYGDAAWTEKAGMPQWAAPESEKPEADKPKGDADKPKGDRAKTEKKDP